MQVVVLAGGLGTRMLPYTESVPKILLEVAGRPFAAWLLERLASAGFTEAILCVAHLGDRIRKAIGDGDAFGISVKYADEGTALLGTGGALRNALELLAPLFLVTYGDSFLPFDYAAPIALLDAHPEALGAMAVYANHDAIEPSNTAVAGDWVIRYDKTHAPSSIPLDHIDYGATALRREVVAHLPPGTVLGFDAVQTGLAQAQKLLAFRAPDRFFEIGSPEGRVALEAHLAKQA
jgi:N-acetyl-alpha-D-muramate 1-phosphate uridylyltransferase